MYFVEQMVVVVTIRFEAVYLWCGISLFPQNHNVRTLSISILDHHILEACPEYPEKRLILHFLPLRTKEPVLSGRQKPLLF